MRIGNQHYRTIWIEEDHKETVCIINQNHLPYDLVIEEINSVDEMAVAIRDMHVRGAGLIGAAAGYGMYLATSGFKNTQDHSVLDRAARLLKDTRPTAVNLSWAVERQIEAIGQVHGPTEKQRIALETAQAIADEDANYCQRIGEHGLSLIADIRNKKRGETVNVLTHCNAGWLAFVDYGSALAPVYAAHDSGLKVHVWVDETRPRNQGAKLTAWELEQHGVPYSVIADNTGGHLMQHGWVDLVIVGSDRTTYTGDVANKIGTYLKALAARDNGVPFYAALPSSTFDWQIRDGVKEIPIEERGDEEVKYIEGITNEGRKEKVLLTPLKSSVVNYGFDVTPSRLVSGIITERGICEASEAGIMALFPEKQPVA